MVKRNDMKYVKGTWQGNFYLQGIKKDGMEPKTKMKHPKIADGNRVSPLNHQFLIQTDESKKLIPV